MCDTRVEQMFPNLVVVDLPESDLHGDVDGKKSETGGHDKDILGLHRQKHWPKGTSILRHGTLGEPCIKRIILTEHRGRKGGSTIGSMIRG